MFFLRDKYKDPSAPLDQSDTIKVNRKADGWFDTHAVSMRHILETGKIPFQKPSFTGKVLSKFTLAAGALYSHKPMHTNSQSPFSYFSDKIYGLFNQVHTSELEPNHYIDFNADDSLIRSLKNIEENTIERIKNELTTERLLYMDNWSVYNRIQWEKHIYLIISEEFEKIKGLDRYRSEGIGVRSKDTNEYDTGYPINRIKGLNALSHDIDNGTYDVEFDCETMSIIKGIILQKIDDHFLPNIPDIDDPERNFKVSSTYFLWGGHVVDVRGPARHAHIVSSATASIFESTAKVINGSSWSSSRRDYMSGNGHRTFEDLVAGEIVEGSITAYAPIGTSKHKLDNLHHSVSSCYRRISHD